MLIGCASSADFHSESDRGAAFGTLQMTSLLGGAFGALYATNMGGPCFHLRGHITESDPSGSVELNRCCATLPREAASFGNGRLACCVPVGGGRQPRHW